MGGVGGWGQTAREGGGRGERVSLSLQIDPRYLVLLAIADYFIEDFLPQELFCFATL